LATRQYGGLPQYRSELGIVMSHPCTLVRKPLVAGTGVKPAIPAYGAGICTSADSPANVLPTSNINLIHDEICDIVV